MEKEDVSDGQGQLVRRVLIRAPSSHAAERAQQMVENLMHVAMQKESEQKPAAAPSSAATSPAASTSPSGLGAPPPPHAAAASRGGGGGLDEFLEGGGGAWRVCTAPCELEPELQELAHFAIRLAPPRWLGDRPAAAAAAAAATGGHEEGAPPARSPGSLLPPAEQFDGWEVLFADGDAEAAPAAAPVRVS